MKKLLAGLVTLAAVVAIISCGGGGARTFSPAAREVQGIQRFSFLSMLQSGLFFPGFGFGGGSGSNGGTTGSGGGAPSMGSIGGFVRNFSGPGGAPRSMMLSSLDGGTTGGTNGGGGGGTGGNEYFYYDEWLQLWVDSQWTETSFNSQFYLDQAKTQPAGHMTSTFVENWEVYPQIYTSEYEFTGGTQAGSHGTYNCTQVNELEGSMTYSNVYADGSNDEGQSSWSATGSEWESRWENGGATVWYEDSGSWNPDGSGTYACSSSGGWSSSWTYNADWSGSAHFEGPDPLLPANMTWTANGVFHIVFADGSSETWTWEDIWGSGSGVGTSGSTNGSTGVGGSGSTGEGTTGAGTSG